MQTDREMARGPQYEHNIMHAYIIIPNYITQPTKVHIHTEQYNKLTLTTYAIHKILLKYS